MIKIGFVDHYINEWHANNYPTWIKKANEELGTDFVVVYAYATLNKDPEQNMTTEEWCKKNGIQMCSSIEEICEKSDCLLVLAPSNPEVHLDLAKKVLPYGKVTYIDKTFAPDLKTAEEIFALSKKYHAPIFSSSALRYANELNNAKNTKSLITFGTGRTVEEYIIHEIEMVVKIMGVGATDIKLSKNGEQYIFNLKYKDNKNATMLYVADGNLPFAINADATYYPIESDFFYDLIKDILRFYQTKKPSFNSEETLEVMRIREAAINSLKEEEKWIKL